MYLKEHRKLFPYTNVEQEPYKRFRVELAKHHQAMKECLSKLNREQIPLSEWRSLLYESFNTCCDDNLQLNRGPCEPEYLRGSYPRLSEEEMEVRVTDLSVRKIVCMMETIFVARRLIYLMATARRTCLRQINAPCQPGDNTISQTGHTVIRSNNNGTIQERLYHKRYMCLSKEISILKRLGSGGIGDVVEARKEEILASGWMSQVFDQGIATPDTKTFVLRAKRLDDYKGVRLYKAHCLQAVLQVSMYHVTKVSLIVGIMGDIICVHEKNVLEVVNKIRHIRASRLATKIHHVEILK